MVQPSTGASLLLTGDSPPTPGQTFKPEEVAKMFDFGSDEERERFDALDSGEDLVAVEAEVVQKLRLGERELERRKKRSRGTRRPPDGGRTFG